MVPGEEEGHRPGVMGNMGQESTIKSIELFIQEVTVSARVHKLEGWRSFGES